MEFLIAPADPQDPRVAGLFARLDEMHRSLYPPTTNHLTNPPDLADSAYIFFAAYQVGGEKKPVGVACLRRAEGYAEVKRVFVLPERRGSGVAVALVNKLEATARAEGYERARLETGTRQPRAVAFYRKLGYEETGPFGPYRPDEYSIFMAKDLGRPGLDKKEQPC